jgi:hydrogenase maturation factor
VSCDAGHCITCSDEAVELRVVRVDGERSLALCEDAAGARSSVEIALIEPVALGDVLLVHAGTALSRVTAGQTPRSEREAGCLAEVPH